jgi:hypothetical protein
MDTKDAAQVPDELAASKLSGFSIESIGMCAMGLGASTWGAASVVRAPRQAHKSRSSFIA